MKKLQEKLSKVQVEKLEERKEFTFYCTPKTYYCNNPCHNHTPSCEDPDGGGGTGGND